MQSCKGDEAMMRWMRRERQPADRERAADVHVQLLIAISDDEHACSPRLAAAGVPTGSK